MTQAHDESIYRPSALICLGSNLPSRKGVPQKIIEASLLDVGRDVGRIITRSRLFTTPCWPPGAGPDYVNAAVKVETDLAPNDILIALHRIEADYGRTRHARWEARVLDLDLIAIGDLVRPDAAVQTRWREMPIEKQKRLAPQELILPHPRMAERAFVLVPLADVAPDWRHPITGRTVSDMLEALPDATRAEIKVAETIP